MTDQKKSQKPDETETPEDVAKMAEDRPLGQDVAEEAISRPEDLPQPPAAERYLPGDPPPSQSMHPPREAPPQHPPRETK